MRKLNLFDPLKEVQPVPFPTDQSIVWWIKRTGLGKVARQRNSEIRAEALAALERQVTDGGKEVLDRLQEDAAKGHLDQALDSTALIRLMKKAMEPDAAEVLDLVDRVDGLLAEDGGSLGWTPELGAELMAEYPDILPPWVKGEAERIEREFQAYLADALKNSGATSDPASVPEVETTP